MRMKTKLALPVLFLLFFIMSLSIFAETVPEPDVIGKDIIVEREENIVEYYKRIGNPNQDIEMKEDLHIIFTKDFYLRKVILPSAYLVIFSVILFCCFRIRNKIASVKERRINEQQ